MGCERGNVEWARSREKVAGMYRDEAIGRKEYRALAIELATALHGTLSWLSSYRGEGALPQYEKVRAALARAAEMGIEP